MMISANACNFFAIEYRTSEKIDSTDGSVLIKRLIFAVESAFT